MQIHFYDKITAESNFACKQSNAMQMVKNYFVF